MVQLQTWKQPPFFFSKSPEKLLQFSRGSPGAGDERLKEAWSHAEEAVLLMLRCHLCSVLSMGWNWDQNENPEKRSETFLRVSDSWLENWKRKSYNLLWIVQSGRKHIEVNWVVLFQRRKQRLHSLKVIAVAWERKLSGEGVCGCLMSCFLQQNWKEEFHWAFCLDFNNSFIFLGGGRDDFKIPLAINLQTACNCKILSHSI